MGDSVGALGAALTGKHFVSLFDGKLMDPEVSGLPPAENKFHIGNKNRREALQHAANLYEANAEFHFDFDPCLSKARRL